MPTTNFPPTANASVSLGVGIYAGGSTDYNNLSDADDATFFDLEDNIAATALFPIGDMPIGFNTAATITINFRMREATKGDIAELDYVQMMKADGTTALTPASTTVSSSTLTSYTFTPGSLYYFSKADWDGAKIKIKNKIGTAATYWAELSVDITYSEDSPIPNGSGDPGDAFFLLVEDDD